MVDDKGNETGIKIELTPEQQNVIMELQERKRRLIALRQTNKQNIRKLSKENVELNTMINNIVHEVYRIKEGKGWKPK